MRTRTNTKFIEAMSMVGIAASLTLIASCAGQTAAEKKVDAEVAQEQPLPPQALSRAGKEILFEADSLSPTQKQRLRALHSKSTAESARLRQEISKNQLVLMKSLVNPGARDEEIDLLKNRIVDLERNRTKLFLSTLDDARRILGRRNSDDEKFYQMLIQEPLFPEGNKNL